LPQAVFVFLAGAVVSVYLGVAGVRFGLAMGPLLVVLILLAAACPLIWFLSFTLLQNTPGESRDEVLKKRAFPFLAAWVLAVLLPEFLFGAPSKTRVILILFLAGAVFCLLAMLAPLHRLRGVMAWAEFRSGSIATAVVILHAVIFGSAIVIRHAYFGAEHGDDTAYYNQIFWSTLQGEFFRGSVTQDRYFDSPVSTEFAIHNSPVLLAVLPLYSLYPSFYTLLILRNLLLSASAIPLYLLAKERIGGVAGILVMVGYFFSTNIFYQAMNGFYSLHFVVLFLPFAFLYFFRERFWPFVVWLILTLSVREEIALTVSLFGVYALFLRRQWQWVLAPIVLSAVWWYVSTELVMIRSRIAMEELEAFYEAFGGGHNSALATVLEKPGMPFTLLLTRENFSYLYEILKPTAGFPFLSASSIFILPTVVVNSVIGAFMATMRNISYHYSVVASVFVFVALIGGISHLARHSRSLGVERSVFCVGMTLLLMPGITLGVMDNIRYGGGGGASIVADFLPKPHQKTLEKIVALVPPDASVAAPNTLMPQLSYRRKLYSSDRLWRYGEREIEYIIFDARPDLLSDRDRNKPKYESAMERIRHDARYELTFMEGGFEVYHLRTSARVPLAG
jgi:uncharacterized membrane protein